MLSDRQLAKFKRRTIDRFVQVIVNQETTIVKKICAELQTKLDPAIDGIFHDLAIHFMGVEDDIYDLLSLTGFGATGQPYAALSAKYAYAKGSNAFWIFADLPIPTAIRKAQKQKKRRFTTRTDNASLITTFKGLSGTKLFGKVKITVNGQSPQSPNLVPSQLYSKAGQIGGAKFEIKLGFFGTLNRKFDNVEQILFQNSRNKTYHKLMNRTSAFRPLLVPFLEFYMAVVIPQIIDSVVTPYLRANSKGKTTYKISDTAKYALS